MGDNGSRRGAYQLPSIKTLTGSPPRPAAPPPLPPDARQQPQSLPPQQPVPHYDQKRHYGQPPVPQPPPQSLSKHYSKPPPLHPHPHPPLLPTVGSSSVPHHGAPLPHSGVSSHDYAGPPRQEYQQHQPHPHYSQAHTHSHAHGYPYAHTGDQSTRYSEQAATAPTVLYHQPSPGRLAGAYSGGSYPQKYVTDSAQPSPGAGPMDVADMGYSHPHPRLPPQQIPSPDQVASPSSQAFQHLHLHYHPPPPPPPPPPVLPVRPPQHPLPRQSQQAVHSPHYSHTHQRYPTYAPAARESPGNAAAYDAYGEAAVGAKAVDTRLVPRQQKQQQLAPGPALSTRAPPPPPPLSATIASHATAPLQPPLPPPPLASAGIGTYPPPPAPPGSVGSVIISKDSAAISNIDEDEDEDDEDDDDNEKGEDEALIKRRKRNAQSAARLRERRKTREFELTSSCTKLETQIARLEDELTDEKRRAKLELKSSNSGGTTAGLAEEAAAGDTAAEPAIPTYSSSSSGRRRGMKRQWLAAQTDGEGDVPMGNADEGEDSATVSTVQLKSPKRRSRPLRELDQVRLDDLRGKIETLGKLNQKVCVNLGLLRQEIQRISNAIVSQKSDRRALAMS
ncbi:hypothetical protein GGI20_002602 [Coemansia sp. BCRC 34301]|nr:hypothetical protein GGI20_002602 [Coemansia sp. BCRC 34301]